MSMACAEGTLRSFAMPSNCYVTCAATGDRYVGIDVRAFALRVLRDVELLKCYVVSVQTNNDETINKLISIIKIGFITTRA